ncbi:MAG: OpgC domain-containing protein [Porphyrobacter sp.]|nr:OpgC domain-containing protein [Porphyrobacter sp.]
MRDERLDILRGYAMVTIVLNHFAVLLFQVGLDGFPIPTLTYFGFSSAAEIFFLMSGWMVGLVYLRRPNRDALVLKRAAKIYAFNVIAFVAAIFAAWLAGPAVAKATDVSFTLAHPLTEVARFLVFLQHPFLLGVLMLYVLFMLAVPLAARLLDRSPALLIAASGAIYLTVQVVPQLNLPGGAPNGDLQWNFNPLAWQLLFFVGMWLGKIGFHRTAFDYFAGRIVVTAALVALLLLCAVLYRLDLRGVLSVPFVGKENLEPVRLVHAVFVVATLAALIANAPSILKPVLDWLALNGRQTLYCFTASIPLTYLATGLWLAVGGGYVAYLAIAALMVLVITLVALLAERWRGSRKPAGLGHQDAAASDSAGALVGQPPTR